MRAKDSRGRGSRRRPEPDLSKEDLVKHIQKSADRGLNLQRILEDFDATPAARKQIKDILNQLVKEGKLAKHRGNRYEAAARDLVEGTIVVHRDGYGFVIPKEKPPGVDSDIFIPAALLNSAMNGDKVKVEITFRKSGGPGKPLSASCGLTARCSLSRRRTKSCRKKSSSRTMPPSTRTRSSKSSSHGSPAKHDGRPEKSFPLLDSSTIPMSRRT